MSGVSQAIDHALDRTVKQLLVRDRRPAHEVLANHLQRLVVQADALKGTAGSRGGWLGRGGGSGTECGMIDNQPAREGDHARGDDDENLEGVGWAGWSASGWTRWGGSTGAARAARAARPGSADQTALAASPGRRSSRRSAGSPGSADRRGIGGQPGAAFGGQPGAAFGGQPGAAFGGQPWFCWVLCPASRPC